MNTFNKEGKKVTTNTLEVTRDTEAPNITSFATSNLTTSGFTGNVIASDTTSGLATKNDAYQYKTGTVVNSTQAGKSYKFTNITKDNIRTITVVVKDRAGWKTSKDLTLTEYSLKDVANIGDNIGYDPGVWGNTQIPSNVSGVSSSKSKMQSASGVKRCFQIGC